MANIDDFFLLDCVILKKFKTPTLFKKIKYYITVYWQHKL